jgi:cytochrome c oxidase cbb3-type subunit 2
LAVAGQKVYASAGCVYCHSQQVRLDPTSTDIAKKLGVRQTVPRDYIREKTAFLGKRRIGQDLSNVGARISDANALHQYLYEPATVTPWGKMPSYRYLYKTTKVVSQPSADAIQGLKGPHAPPAGYEVIPTEDAKALVAYLLSLNKNYPLPESPEPTAK